MCVPWPQGSVDGPLTRRARAGLTLFVPMVNPVPARGRLVEPVRVRSRFRERVVLTVSLGAAGLLVFAASVAGGDPESAAALSLERLADAGAAAVAATWARVVTEDRPAPALGTVLQWSGDDRLDVVDAAPRVGRTGASADFLSLLDAALRTELVDGIREQALADLEELLDRDDGGGVPRALALSRAVRLAAHLGQSEHAASLFRTAFGELRGDEAEFVGDEPVSALLLAGLALSDSGEALVERWIAGELALPGGDPRVELDGEDLVVRDAPLRTALLERLVHLVGENNGLTARERARIARGLIAAVGELDFAVDGSWRLHTTPLGTLCVRASQDGERTVMRVDPRAVAERLAQRISEAAILPEDLVLELSPEARGIRGPIALAGGGPSFALRHVDAGGILAAEVRRARTLQLGLIGAALAVAFAGWSAARAMARERRLVELRARFVASVTHELRTPLASILMLAENLDQGRALDSERRSRYPALILREAERLRRLVDDVLETARLEQGAPPRVEREDVELVALGDELREQLEQIAMRAGSALHVHVDASLAGNGRVDREALRRAAQNLVANALEHGRSNTEPEVNLSVKDGRLRLAVRDHGPGVPHARREEAFAPFERLEAGATPGAGLGLWIVRELARAQGGDAWFDNPVDGAGVVAVFEVDHGQSKSDARGDA